MGIEVSHDGVYEHMERYCSVLNLTLINPRQANVILKCTGNSPGVFLRKAELSPNALFLGLYDRPLGVSNVRCPNWTP